MALIITAKAAEKIANAKEGELVISLDLGRSSAKIVVAEGFALIEGQKIPLPEFKSLKDNFYYAVEDNSIKKVAFFAEDTNLYYKLLPAEEWPTFTISSTPMHRHVRITPKHDTELKINEIKPVKGKVLDTCTGLGYTAIMASANAEKVYTFEKDKNVMFIAKYNPYSKELFENKKIELKNENVFDGIKNFKNEFFDRIIHDPPTFSRSPELYSDEFHKEMFRVLKKGGIIYHYCPLPGKMSGRQFQHTIIRKLKEAGFIKVEYHEKSSGIRAVKH